MDRFLKSIVVAFLFGAFALLALSGFYVNNLAPGSSSTQTPISLSTSSPVAVIQCGAQLSSNAVGYYISNIKVCCRNAAAAKVYYNWGAQVAATPCATAVPAPNASTPSGGELDLVSIQQSLFSACMTYGPGPYAGGNSFLNGELDMVSNVTGTTCTSEAMP